MEKINVSMMGVEEISNSEMSINGGTFDPIGTFWEYVFDVAIEETAKIIRTSFKDGTQGNWFAMSCSNNPCYTPLR